MGSQTVFSIKPKNNNSRFLFVLGAVFVFLVLLALMMFAALTLHRMIGLPGWGGRYILLIIWFIVVAVDLGIRYVRYAFGLADNSLAARWLFASVVWPEASRLKLWDTSLKSEVLEKPNLIKTVGGPGVISIASGLAAVVESLDGNIRVLEKGEYTLDRLERVKEVVRPDELVTDHVEKKQVVTRDGIVVDATDIHFNYRLNRGLNGGLEEAAKRRVYNLAIDGKGEADWGNAIRGAVTGPITRWVSENTINYLVASGFSKNTVSKPDPAKPPLRKTDPRGKIIEKVDSDGKKALENLGAELLFCDIGHFELPKEVNAKLAETWTKTWEGKIEIMRAKKEVARLRYRRAYTLGRTEAQIDLLIKIVKGLDGLSSKTPLPPNSSNIYVTGLTQLLDALGKDAADQREPPKSG